jgi:hypothetical protein
MEKIYGGKNMIPLVKVFRFIEIESSPSSDGCRALEWFPLEAKNSS